GHHSESEIERESDDLKLALMIQREGGVAGIKAREGTERNLRAVGRLYINIFQRIRILLELRIHFQNHVILIELGKNRGDLPLAKGIVKRVVNVGGKNAESRGGVAVDGVGSDEIQDNMDGGDVAKIWARLHLVIELRGILCM